jgi:hypothetical protein
LCVRGGPAGRCRGRGERSMGRNVSGARPAWRRCNFGTDEEERQGRACRLQAGGEEGGADAGLRETGGCGSAPILKMDSWWLSSPC